MEHLTGGGAPLLGEPPPIELANTVYAARGRRKEGLQTVEHLAAWLRDMRQRLAVELDDADIHGVTDRDLRLTRELRDAIRTLCAAAVEGHDLDPDAVATLNRHASQTPRWHELRTVPEPHAVVCSKGRPVSAAFAALAEDAVDLFAGPSCCQLRICHAPGCVLYFVRDIPRREWCSPGCGNRVRAARHYAKVRKETDD